MSVTKKYLDVLQSKLNEIVETQVENIEAAAKLVVESCENGGRFYVFGSGHSHMVAEEIYIRAGGLGYVKAILPPELMLHEMPNKSTWLERLDGFSKAMLDEYDYNEINKSFQTYDLNWITKKEASDSLVHNITIIDKLNEATLQESYHEYYYDLLKFKFANFELQKISGDFNDDYLDEDERLIFVYKSI